ncbi:hypothetical protein H4R19_000348 [Coemansia spiralis]|nr:hypothetical protein H4R19_000348 [Coemansia spiralis]
MTSPPSGAPAISAIGIKNLLTDDTKHHILCYMFTHFSFTDNRISQLGNPRSQSCAMLRMQVIQAQPSLATIGAQLDKVLESFVSNQNSRIFCALGRLHEWYTSTLPFALQGLTLKHLKSMFSRPPCVNRPHTELPTYAMRVTMIYHLCDPESWRMILDAYSQLYTAIHGCVWTDRFMFEVGTPNNLLFPQEILDITRCCVSSFVFPSPWIQPPAAVTYADAFSSLPATDIGSDSCDNEHGYCQSSSSSAEYCGATSRTATDARSSPATDMRSSPTTDMRSSPAISVAIEGSESPQPVTRRPSDRGPAFPHVGYLGGAYPGLPAVGPATPGAGSPMPGGLAPATEQRIASAPGWFVRDTPYPPAAAGTTPHELLQTASAPAFRFGTPAAATPQAPPAPQGAANPFIGSPYLERPRTPGYR